MYIMATHYLSILNPKECPTYIKQGIKTGLT